MAKQSGDHKTTVALNFGDCLGWSVNSERKENSERTVTVTLTMIADIAELVDISSDKVVRVTTALTTDKT